MGLIFSSVLSRRGDLADTAALLQILQGVHREEGEGMFQQIGNPALGQLLPTHTGADIFRHLGRVGPWPREPLWES